MDPLTYEGCMSDMINLDASVFEDKNYKFRLSTRYAVDNNLFKRFSYEELCRAFFTLCPNIVKVPPPPETAGNLLRLGDHSRKLAKWCSEYASGYWMNSNFPATAFNVFEGNVLNRYWSFQFDHDAIMFKLTFC